MINRWGDNGNGSVILASGNPNIAARIVEVSLSGGLLRDSDDFSPLGPSLGVP